MNHGARRRFTAVIGAAPFPYFVLGGLHLISRIVYAWAGIRFRADTLTWYFQYLDVALLRERLAESLLFMPGQPPLFNLFLGIILKIFGPAADAAYNVVYVLGGLGITLLLYALCRKLRVHPLLAVAVSLGYAIAPATVLHENILAYTIPVAGITLALVYVLASGILTGRTAWVFWGMTCAALLVGVRSSFHFLFMVMLLGYLLVVYPRGSARKILRASLVPLLVSLSFFVKNWILFGQFVSSTWLGMNWWRVTVQALPPDLREQLVEEGRMVLADRHTFLPLDGYPEALWRTEAEGCQGAAILCARLKSTGETNFNHRAYIAISRVMLQDDLVAIRSSPLTVLRRAASGFGHYLWPASTFDHVESNLNRIRGWSELWDRYLFLRTELPGRAEAPEWSRYIYPGLAFWVLLPMGWGVVSVLRRAIGRNMGLTIGESAVTGLILLVLLYSATVLNLFEYGENMRYRFETSPLGVVLIALMLTALLGRLFRRSPAPATPAV